MPRNIFINELDKAPFLSLRHELGEREKAPRAHIGGDSGPVYDNPCPLYRLLAGDTFRHYKTNLYHAYNRVKCVYRPTPCASPMGRI